jgi:FkbM family methyltransferase
MPVVTGSTNGIRRRIDVRARGAFLALARRVTPYVAVERDGATFLFPSSDPGVGRTAFLSGANPEFEALDRAVAILRARGLAGAGTTFVDVGANIGTTTLPAVLRHGYGRAVCFEPEPENVPILTANAALNAVLDRVEIVEAAVSDRSDRVPFGRGPRTASGRRTGVGNLGRSDGEVLFVDVVTLGEALSERGIDPTDVGLLWIDVQGHEGHVLAGARAIVDAGVPFVFALRHKKLRKAGGVDLLLESAAARRWMVDLRDADAEPEPAEGLSERVRRGPNTDILVF